MRSYEKSNPEKPIAEPKPYKTELGDIATSQIKDTGQNYRKEEGVRMPFTFVVIVSGGEVREKAYFTIISNKDKFQRIKIEFIADSTMNKGEGNPDKLLKIAKDKKERYATSQEEKPDEIFIVSDVDEFIDSLLRIKPECETSGIHLIISNSCFEVWLYYGKFSNQPPDFSIPSDISKISQSFKTYLGSKVEGGIDPRKAIFDIHENIKNAKANYTEDTNGIPELFSTNMFLLAEALLPFIQDELDILIAENTRKRVKIFAKQLAKLTMKEIKELIAILKSK
jgi:hypothetical protein